MIFEIKEKIMQNKQKNGDEFIENIRIAVNLSFSVETFPKKWYISYRADGNVSNSETFSLQ